MPTDVNKVLKTDVFVWLTINWITEIDLNIVIRNGKFLMTMHQQKQLWMRSRIRRIGITFDVST